jgi:hypothetical protein
MGIAEYSGGWFRAEIPHHDQPISQFTITCLAPFTIGEQNSAARLFDSLNFEYASVDLWCREIITLSGNTTVCEGLGTHSDDVIRIPQEKVLGAPPGQQTLSDIRGDSSYIHNGLDCLVGFACVPRQ